MNGKVVERPQYMLMRVALGIHGAAIEAALETYGLLSEGYFTHASPTLYYAGAVNGQLSSCFLLTMVGNSIAGIYETVKRCALISHGAGGIGLAVSCVPSSGVMSKRDGGGSGGGDCGLVPVLRVLNSMARHVCQGGNKRPGAIAVYLEPWHPDVFDFLSARKNTGAEERRARDLFYGLWVPDEFMRRVEADAEWSLFDPCECPRLDETWGCEFDELYRAYERAGKARRTVRARDVWLAVVESQVETGMPYMCYKDHANRKSNHQHLGTVRTSNVCTEIVEYCSQNEVAVCTLASIALNRFVCIDNRDGLDTKGPVSAAFDFAMLERVTRIIVRNLNKIIDVNHYPVEEARVSNLRHRPIGVGVQALADCFALMGFAFDSEEARRLNVEIFETIYYAALDESVAIAEAFGPFESYAGSPLSRGIIQPDMWSRPLTDERHAWSALRARLTRHGARNSLLVAPMPTASTAQILGNNESIEPYTSNIYTRRVLSGEFQVVNAHLVRELDREAMWNEDMKMAIVANGGSVQKIDEIPLRIRRLYKTAWELSQRTIVQMAADRAPFIDQSQSLNIHMVDADYGKVTSMHFYAWKLVRT